LSMEMPCFSFQPGPVTRGPQPSCGGDRLATDDDKVTMSSLVEHERGDKPARAAEVVSPYSA